MKRIILFSIALIISVTILAPVFSFANDGENPVQTPEITVSPENTTLEPTATAPAKPTTQPIATNKGEITIIDPGDKDAATNSTGEIIFVLAIVLVCLFFVFEGFFSLFIKKKKR